MTLSKVTMAQEGIPTSQSGSPTTKAACIGKNPNHPQNVTFCSGRGTDRCSGKEPDRCYICSQQLCFQWVTLSKDIGAQEGISISQNGPRSQKWPGLAKTRPNLSPHVTFCSGKRLNRRPDFSTKRRKSTKKYHVPPWQGTRQMFHWQSNTLFSIKDLK